MDSLMNKKVNSRFEIFNELDINNYKVEKDDQKNEYKLKGVVVHNGTADYGHYYSYILTDRQKNVWKEFNDSNVKFFNFSDFEKETFGGINNANSQKSKFYST